MDSCPSHKKVFRTQDIAEDALIEARTRYEYASGHGPINVYRCDECGYYHLTSSGVINPRLAQLDREGKLHLKKTGQAWESRINKRSRNK